ncbi:MAG: hypothetical protein ACREQV_11085 [Candidatus Binatia bacterium]
MDNERLAKDLVVGYVAGHDIPANSDMQRIAENLIEFYRLTKAELDKANANAQVSPIGFGNRPIKAKNSSED